MRKLFTLFLLPLLPLLASADQVVSGGLYYNVNPDDRTAEVVETYEIRYSGDIVIPPSFIYDAVEYRVVGIARRAFYSCKELTSVVIPTSVTTIGENAFANCSGLTSVDIPHSVTTIGDYAFNSSGLTSVTIPGSVTNNLDGVFHDCKDLKTAIVEDGVKGLSSQVFLRCSSLESVTISKTVEYIQDDVFRDCPALSSIVIDLDNPYYDSRNDCNAVIEKEGNKLIIACKNTVIPEGVEKLERRVFENTGITSVTIPKSLTNFIQSAFDGCTTLETISVAEGHPVFDSRDNCNAVIRTADNSLYLAPCKEFTIPNSVTKIESNAFIQSELTSLTIPASIKYIHPDAFLECLSLESISVEAGNSVYDSRDNCNAIIETATNTLYAAPAKDFTIPNSVTAIGDGAFRCNRNLTSLFIPKQITSIEQLAFQGIAAFTLETIQVDKDNPVYDSREDCNAIIETATNTLIVGTPKTIIPSTVTAIGSGAFTGREIYVVRIPEGVTVIGSNAFSGCNYLKQITFPSTLTRIGYYGIAWCNQLENIYCYATTPPEIQSYYNYEGSYDGNFNRLTLHVPAGCVEAYRSANGWGKSMEIVEIKGISTDNIVFKDPAIESACVKKWDTGGDGALSYEEAEAVTEMSDLFESSDNLYDITSFDELQYFKNVKTIGESTFARARNMASIILPEGLTTIEGHAFYWTAFTSITIPSTVTSIGIQAFDQCDNLVSVTALMKKPCAISRFTFGNSANATLYVPVGSKSAYASADYWKEFKSIVESDGGDVIQEKEVVYTPNEEEKTLIVQRADPNVNEVIIQSEIEIGGEKYEVTAIGDGAFENNKNLEKVSIPETIEAIGDDAFAGCTNLKQIRVDAAEPIKLGSSAAGTRGSGASSVFAEVDMETCVLYVPAGSKEKYEQADGWKDFKNIVEMAAITIGSKGKSTYTGKVSLDFNGMEDVKAYVATGFDKDEGTIWLTRVKDVPAGVPVLIKGDANKTYNVPVTDSENSYYTNMFVGNTSGESVKVEETDGDLVNYYLSGDGVFKSVKGYVNIGNNKCYLQLPGTFKEAVSGSAQTITVGASGKASYAAPVDLDFTNVEGLKAFTATGYDKSTKTIWLTRVMKAQKGEGLLLKGDPKEYDIPSMNVQSAYMNMFVGNISGEKIQVNATSDDGSETNYYLSLDGTFKSVNGYVNINDKKCYLALPTSMVAVASTRSAEENYKLDEPEMISMPIVRSIESDKEGTTNLTPALSKGEGEWYTLQGQRVAKPGKGLYIRNGKKVVIK